MPNNNPENPVEEPPINPAEIAGEAVLNETGQQLGTDASQEEMAEGQKGNMINRLKGSLEKSYKDGVLEEAGKTVLKYGVKKPAQIAKSVTLGSIGFQFIALPKVLLKEVKIIGETLWRALNEEKAPSIKEVWGEFFPKKKKGEEK